MERKKNPKKVIIIDFLWILLILNSFFCVFHYLSSYTYLKKKKKKNTFKRLMTTFLFQMFLKNFVLIFGLYLRRKKFYPDSWSIFWWGKLFSSTFSFQYESTNFCSAGLLKIPLIVTPLLKFKYMFTMKQKRLFHL